MTQAIFMVGARGAGKTTIGKALALALKYRFIDTDLFMQQTLQSSVAEIVAREGWDGFRLRESIALQTVTAAKTVVATGGGAVLSHENRAFMRNHGIVIYLRASADVLAERLTEDPEDAQRPSLTGKPIVEEMLDVLASREALYQDVAHHVLDATQPPEDVVEQILQILADEKVK
ncbi:MULTISPECIES: shikimate kinase AroL [Yersinia]|uniref:shikimate kinase AroL n=1 Tax=Yersinia TaxID=629 RepID=UPI0005E12BEA|nr:MULTISPECIES: shikimate kinase AroL [Yersinia]OVZ98422.1 shikimate kinase II [Yersinia frederiksenii]RXA95117.1 shikimate kinase AroL [Yersinia sp. 2105 StPb PI]CNI27133.1 shikimate kinase [Yersinia frederiksenii]CNJ11251.1 shikimate kinase [Yersinia frederiksenii]CNK80615.1 shikimate kinase [Yersinia frederiksenii]